MITAFKLYIIESGNNAKQCKIGDKMNTLPAWNIKQLHEALINDLKLCRCDFERSMVKAIGGKEIREKAREFAATRKLTPIELAILENY